MDIAVICSHRMDHHVDIHVVIHVGIQSDKHGYPFTLRISDPIMICSPGISCRVPALTSGYAFWKQILHRLPVACVYIPRTIAGTAALAPGTRSVPALHRASGASKPTVNRIKQDQEHTWKIGREQSGSSDALQTDRAWTVHEFVANYFFIFLLRHLRKRH